jgi:hypothetical protein
MTPNQYNKISMLGLKETSTEQANGEYIGIYTERDIVVERKELQHTMDNCHLPNWDCSYNRYTGIVDCGDACSCFDCLVNFGYTSDLDEAEQCPVETLRSARRNLSLLNTVTLMRHVFSNPVLATSNGFLEKESLV